MFEKYKPQIDRLIYGSINTPGDTGSNLRQNIITRGKNQIKAQHQTTESLPPELREFVDKVTFTPYDISDEEY